MKSSSDKIILRLESFAVEIFSPSEKFGEWESSSDKIICG